MPRIILSKVWKGERPLKRRTKAIAAAAALGTLVAASAGFVAANNQDPDDETDAPIVGSDLDRASDAALAHVGQGRVTETEVGDEESYYEVEVTLDDGSQVDVQLDEGFAVVGDERDSESDDD